MPAPTLPFYEPLVRLTQANLAAWTQFWMSPDQPWSPTRSDLFGRAPGAPASANGQALSRLWSGLMENQTRFLAEVGQGSMTAWQAVPAGVGETVRNAT